MFLDRYGLRRLQDTVQEGAESGGAGDVESSESPESIDHQKMIQSLKKENEAMQAKMQELLGEAKTAKELRREAEERARREAEEVARKKGDYEQLHKSSEEERQKLQQELENLRQNIAKEKEQSTAMKIAAELAEGANAEILSEFVARRLRYTEEGIKITDNNGQLTVSTPEDLVNEFKTSTKFAALLKGSQASGGSAPGNVSSGSATSKILTRADFQKMDPKKQMEFVKKGGSIQG